MNRFQKSYLPPNILTAANATTLNHVKKTCWISRNHRKEKQICAWSHNDAKRIAICKSFSWGNRSILSIGHAKLEWELSDIKFTTLTQYENYKCDYLKNKKFGFDRDDGKLVFITPEERKSFEDIKNKSKEFILKKINDMLSKINSDKKIFLKLLGKAPMRLKKSALLEIYDEVKLACELKEIKTSVVSVPAGTGDLCVLYYLKFDSL